MTLLGTIVVGVGLLVGVLNGLRRGAAKESIALVGVLLGALLVTLWATRWGAVIAQRTGWQGSTGQWIGTMILLWGTAVFGGYGGASLLGRSPARITGRQRIVGALLGLVNATLLLGLSLRATQTLLYREVADDVQPTWIRSGVASRFLLDYFDLIVLGAAWTFAVVALVVTLIHLVGRFFAASRPAPAPAAPAKPAGTPQPTPGGPVIRDTAPTQPTPTIPPGMERSFLDKPGGQGRP